MFHHLLILTILLRTPFCVYFYRGTFVSVDVALHYLQFIVIFFVISTCMQVGLGLCVLTCLSVHIHILYEHMPLCHRGKGGCIHLSQSIFWR